MKACTSKKQKQKKLESESGDRWQITLVDHRSAKGSNVVSLYELKQELLGNRGACGLHRSYLLFCFLFCGRTPRMSPLAI